MSVLEFCNTISIQGGDCARTGWACDVVHRWRMPL